MFRMDFVKDFPTRPGQRAFFPHACFRVFAVDDFVDQDINDVLSLPRNDGPAQELCFLMEFLPKDLSGTYRFEFSTECEGSESDQPWGHGEVGCWRDDRYEVMIRQPISIEWGSMTAEIAEQDAGLVKEFRAAWYSQNSIKFAGVFVERIA